MADGTLDPTVELVELLGTLREIESVQWDLLGEYLGVKAKAGPIGRRLAPVTWALTPESAAALHLLLGRALDERAGAAPPMQ